MNFIQSMLLAFLLINTYMYITRVSLPSNRTVVTAIQAGYRCNDLKSVEESVLAHWYNPHSSP